MHIEHTSKSSGLGLPKGAGRMSGITACEDSCSSTPRIQVSWCVQGEMGEKTVEKCSFHPRLTSTCVKVTSKSRRTKPNKPFTVNWPWWRQFHVSYWAVFFTCCYYMRMACRIWISTLKLTCQSNSWSLWASLWLEVAFSSQAGSTNLWLMWTLGVTSSVLFGASHNSHSWCSSVSLWSDLVPGGEL